MDLSVIIRGPLFDCSLDNIPIYIEQLGANIIISHWEDGSEKQLVMRVWDNGWRVVSCEPIIPKYRKEHLYQLHNKYNILVVRNKYKDIRFQLNFTQLKDANRNIYQLHSTLKGLESCDTKYAICMRSDIPYPNLIPIKEKLNQFPEKIITSNTNFKPDRLWKYHAGTHIIAGETNFLKNMYSLCIKLCQNENKDMDEYINNILKIQPQNKPFVGEQLITTAVMILKNENFLTENSKKLMKKHFDVIPIHRLGGIYRRNEQVWFDNGEIIDSMENV